MGKGLRAIFHYRPKICPAMTRKYSFSSVKGIFTLKGQREKKKKTKTR